jgi:alkylmercury lyase-like protein
MNEDQVMELEHLRLAVYRWFAATGRAPTPAMLAAQLGTDDAEITSGLEMLAHNRHLVLSTTDDIVMAHPFSAVPLGFAVMGSATLWWGGCAWDSFALPQLVHEPDSMLVATRCPACDTPHAWNVGQDQPPAGDEVAHFLVPAAHIWDDVVHTCSNQRIFCSTTCVDDWLERTGHPRGYVMDLATLWRLAQHWYDGRLDEGYVRREPAAAAEYFRSVGLAGPFWGL